MDRATSVVENPKFSPEGTRIITVNEDKTARVCDVTNGKPMSEPLRHESDVRSAEFSLDGTRVVTASNDKTARLWDVRLMLQPPLPVPAWMLQRAHAIAGLQFDADGQMKAIPAERRIAVLYQPPTVEDPWARLANWLVLPASERPLTPESNFTRRQIAERERDCGYEEGIESALRYDPTVPLAHLLLAKFERHPPRAAFLRAYGLKRLPDDAVLWARAATSLVEQQDFPDAVKAAEKALTLDPNNTAAQTALKAAKEGTP